MTSRPAALAALPPLLSAFLFGITTPLAKQLLASAHPVLVAGLLYTGSGVGLSLYILARDRGRFSIGIPRSEWRWLGGAVIVGGITAPALLMYGLTHADAAAATLLLNLEVVFTALIAWVVFREATSRRVIAGFVAILLGSVLLALPDHGTGGTPIGALVAILAACLCWAIDNNCTQRISSGDARAIAAVKGLVAGTSNVGLAAVLGATFPEATHVAAALALGFLGYGVSLTLFVYSLRQLGTARTGAYFATAPFLGGACAMVIYGVRPEPLFWAAAACMAFGVWLHLTEQHSHEHTHAETMHSHAHVHDAHHQHDHQAGWDGQEPHTHVHPHQTLSHSHPHYPDIHHDHAH